MVNQKGPDTGNEADRDDVTVGQKGGGKGTASTGGTGVVTKIVMAKRDMSLDELEGSDLIDQALMRLWQPGTHMEKDCRIFCWNLKEWLDVGGGGVPHWQRLAKTWEGFCSELIQKPPDFVDALMSGYAVLDKDVAIPVRVALEAAKSRGRPELKPVGNPGPRDEDTGQFTKSYDVTDGERASERGNRTSYLTDRLRTQRPDLFEKLERGEYPSVRAAAKDAGFVRDTWNLPRDPVAAGEYLRDHDVSEAWIEAMTNAFRTPKAQKSATQKRRKAHG